MAINQLQYMSLSMSVIKYDDVRQRLLSSAKDEDISPFVAVDKYEYSTSVSTQCCSIFLYMPFAFHYMPFASHYMLFAFS